MTDTQRQQLAKALAPYLPEAAIPRLVDFFERHVAIIRITRPRNSKLGDYRWPTSKRNCHAISINGDLGKNFFLLVLLHEMAHYLTYIDHKLTVLPHGHEWQKNYASLLAQYADCFPPETQDTLREYISNIPLSRALQTKLEKKLTQLDHPDARQSSSLTLDDLMPGDLFRTAGLPHIMEAIQKKRTRWVCLDTVTQKRYSISGSMPVSSTKEQ